MAATAQDYLWLDDEWDGWIESYGIAIVSDATVEQVLAAYGTTANGTVPDVDELQVASYEVWEAPDAGYELLVGLVQHGDDVVLLEVNGYVGVTEALVRPLSVGRSVVAHRTDVNAHATFVWWVDGELRLELDPVVGSIADGASDDVRAQVVESGVPLDDGEDEDDGDEDDVDYEIITPATFALAERLSGVAVTPELLRSPMQTALVRIPR